MGLSVTMEADFVVLMKNGTNQSAVNITLSNLKLGASLIVESDTTLRGQVAQAKLD